MDALVRGLQERAQRARQTGVPKPTPGGATSNLESGGPGMNTPHVEARDAPDTVDRTIQPGFPGDPWMSEDQGGPAVSDFGSGGPAVEALIAHSHMMEQMALRGQDAVSSLNARRVDGTTGYTSPNEMPGSTYLESLDTVRRTASKPGSMIGVQTEPHWSK